MSGKVYSNYVLVLIGILSSERCMHYRALVVIK